MGCLKIPYNPGERIKEYPPLKICKGLKKKEEAQKKRNDYYPFGLTFNSSTRSGHTTNTHLFNGMDLQTDLGWGNYLAYYRSYDPTIARWGQVDPKASERESPYVGMGAISIKVDQTNKPFVYTISEN